MSLTTPTFPSRLPNVGTTIFTVMSALAAKHSAINLGQGFPDFSCDPDLIQMVNDAMLTNHNQYPPMIGIEELRQGIAQKLANLYGHQYHHDHEITITAGGTQAILTAVLSCVSPGDEVIIIEPAYDSYRPSIELAGGIPVAISLEVQRDDSGFVQSYQIPWVDLENAINTKTRLLIINTPNNPTGIVWTNSDLERLAHIVRDSNALILSDEVYEHMVFDGANHCSISSHPELVERSFVISSFGKTYHVTGWKVGYVAAPQAMMSEFRKVHQFNVFTVNSPMQYGIARYLNNPMHYLELPRFYQAKRDFFRQGLAETEFKLLPTPGTYFQCVDYSGLKNWQSNLNEEDFCIWLTTEIGVAAIPVSAFYQDKTESKVIRFCFAKKESTLSEAVKRLQGI
ncbi:methionine aminotransferase [Polynucleobacter sphagniphilus]|jgi:methionine aminotransferase|uniref:pyridoxal phosphate-dependent aminotransferase n=1 Tax=Polynucleobacter sphagniphilus TaxID=1743169 RepID=UPI002473F300|nr:pyridoxal phosphate-dependent aminotransferase [Polynucleobacter sphagniphilus]MDH6155577.1 methionine aminotransferase [Polynucleobacter sphagniphilus]